MDRKVELLTALVKQHIADTTWAAMSCQAEVVALKEQMKALAEENADLKAQLAPPPVAPPGA